MHPRFSVIVPAYNQLNLLSVALASIREQHYTDYEAIVVDDGSSDGTPAFLQELPKEVISLSQANAGPSAARNAGARIATGEFLAFLDADDVWLPWTLSTYADIIRETAPAVILGAPAEFTDHVETKDPSAVAVDYFEDYFSTAARYFFVGGSGIVVRRDDFHRVGGFDEKLRAAEDHDLLLRLGNAGRCACVVSPVTYGYRRHDGTLSTQIQSAGASVVRLLQTEKHGGLPGGPARSRERETLLSRVARPAALACLRVGAQREGWGIYLQTLAINIKLGRWRFLSGFVLRSLGGMARRLILRARP